MSYFQEASAPSQRVAFVSIDSFPKISPELVTLFKSGNSLPLLVSILAFILLSVASSRAKKGKLLATSRFGGAKEKHSAASLAQKQLSEKKRSAVTLYVGNPQYNSRLLYLPEAQRGIAVCGGPGSGKTFSIINPAILSAIDQGLPIILYDFKFPSREGNLDGSSQTELIVPYAHLAGYEIAFFAPGFPESSVCNLLDFLRGAADAETARQLGTVMSKNFKLFAQDKEDPFFGPAGEQLCEAVFMLAKSSPYPDLMMCQAILSMDKLAERLESAELNYFIKASFGQLISVGKSEKTVASIIGTANINFTRFMKPSLLAACCGETTLPLNLEGKKLLVLGMDRERRDVVGPIVATVLHMIVNRNVTKGRKEPLVLSLDELPTLYLPSLVNWLNENRSDGLVTLLAFQNIVQLEEVYNKKYKSVLGGCGTKAIFNPQEYDSAKMFSDYLGEEEVHYNQKSHGSSGGKSSTNISEQDRTKKLYEPSQFLKLRKGKCVLINPAYENKQEAAVPILEQIHLSKLEGKLYGQMVQRWPDVRDVFIGASTQNNPTESDLKERYLKAQELWSLQRAAA